MSEPRGVCALVTMHACPTPRGYRLTPEGRRLRPCRRLACPYCGPRIALSTVKAIELANPIGSAAVTLRAPPTEDRARLRAFARILGAVASDLRGDGFTWEYCWILELSPSGLPNVHVLQRGSPVTSLRFRRALAAASGEGDLQPVRHPKILARYCLKLALSGLDVSGIDAAAAMDLHLRLNGGMLLHSSRRFWLDGSGATLPGVVSARARARLAPTGRRPTPEELEEWRAGWKLPPLTPARKG
jgi:hypothetical protein